MAEKMNWDRVRKENLILKHGSAWVESGKVTDPPSGSKSKVQKANSRMLGPSMPGCTCGKATGFVGSHKKRCPLANANPSSKRSVLHSSRIAKQTSPTTTPPQSHDLTISDLANGLCKAGLNGLWKEFLRLQLRMLDSDQGLDQNARERCKDTY